MVIIPFMVPVAIYGFCTLNFDSLSQMCDFFRQCICLQCASLVVIPFIVLELCYIDKFYNFFQRLAVEVEELYDSFMSENRSLQLKSLSALNETFYLDSDIPEKLPQDLKFMP